MMMALHRTLASLALLLASCSQGRLDVVTLAPNSLNQGMVAHWPCDEGTGTTLGDFPSHRYDATILGATWLLDSGHAGFGGALHFESGNSVQVESSFQPASDSWSVSLWVRPAAWASPTPPPDNGDTYVTLISTEIVRLGGWEMNVRFPQLDRTWRYHFAYPNPGDAGGIGYQWAETVGFDVDQWTHLVAVVDSSDAMQILFYKNGERSAEKAITSLILPGSVALYFGTWSDGGRYFVGDLDDIVIYDRALTSDEVVLLHTQPAQSVLR
jgi:hypothetical protein